MENEELIRRLIGGLSHRAIQEHAEAVLVLSALASILADSEVESPMEGVNRPLLRSHADEYVASN